MTGPSANCHTCCIINDADLCEDTDLTLLVHRNASKVEYKAAKRVVLSFKQASGLLMLSLKVTWCILSVIPDLENLKVSSNCFTRALDCKAAGCWTVAHDSLSCLKFVG